MLIYSIVDCAFSPNFALSCAHLRNFKTASQIESLTKVWREAKIKEILSHVEDAFLAVGSVTRNADGIS
jgi:hypothetical protein